MKIVTWNVRAGNKKLSKLITFVVQHHPDVICLQEFPRHALHLLSNLTNYSLSYTCDIQTRHEQNDRLTCILTILPTSSVRTVSYGIPKRSSLIERIVYRTINRFKECHTALVVELVSQQKLVRIISSRLSMAVGTKERIRQAESLFHMWNNDAVNIMCGDFNIVDSKIVNVVSGWARGFKLADYLSNERKMFERVCERYNVVNIFLGKSTWATKIPRLQFDHILVPRGIPVKQVVISNKRFGSDHRMLMADLTI